MYINAEKFFKALRKQIASVKEEADATENLFVKDYLLGVQTSLCKVSTALLEVLNEQKIENEIARIQDEINKI